MAINDISLGNRILDYQNDDNLVEFINSRKCTKAMVNEIGPNNMTPLHIAAINNKYKIIKALLKKGADVNGMFYQMDKPSLPPLHMAIYYGSYDGEQKEENLKVINLLLQNKAHINILNKSPFILASLKSKNEVIQILLNHNVDIHCKDPEGKTGLDHMQYKKNNIGIKIVESHMLSKALQEELTVTKSKQSKKIKV